MKNFLFLLLVLAQISFAENVLKLKIVATVNEDPITNIDVNNQIKFLKSMYDNNLKNEQIYNTAINNLIDENIKTNEIKKNKLTTDNEKINKQYNIILQDLQKKNKFLEEDFKKELYKKVKIEIEWNEIVLKKYFWKININIKEIEEKLKTKENNTNNEKNFLEKDKLISFEKNKKLQFYSNKYLEDLKETSLIKFYK